VAVSIGAAIAINEISTSVDAYISNMGDGLNPNQSQVINAVNGDIVVRAEQNAEINAISSAASIALGFGQAGVAVSGAGAGANNVILTNTNASIQNSTILNADDIDIDATNTSSINAIVAVASVAVGGGQVGVGASIGASVARNLLGFDANGQREGAQVQAYIKDSSITQAGALTLDAISNQIITAEVFAGSVAISGGQFAGSLAGAGVITENSMGADVRAYIDGDGPSGISVDSLSINADDLSTISTDAGAASIAAAVGMAGASVSVGAALAANTIDNNVEAYIARASNTNTTDGGISVTADETATISALTFSASAAVTVAIGGSGALATTGAINTLTSNVAAYIENSSSVQSSTGVLVSANDTSTISAEIVSVSLSAGLVSLAVGVTLTDNAISNAVTAYIANSAVTAGGNNDISVLATSNPTITTTNTVGAVSYGFGGAGAGGSSVTTIGGTTEAYVDDATLTATANNVLVNAASTGNARPTIRGMSGGLASVAVMFSQSSIAGTTSSHVGGETTVNANRIDVHATDSNLVRPDTLVVGVGGITAAGAKSAATISRTTEAFIDSGSVLSLGAAILDVKAVSTSTADGKAGGIAGGGIAIAVLDIESTANATTRAYVGDSASVSAGQLNLNADGTSIAKAPSKVVGVGLLAGAGIQLDAVDTSTAEAYIGASTNTISASPTNVTIMGGGVDVDAKLNSSVEAKTKVTSIGLIGIAGSKTNSESTRRPKARSLRPERSR